jgi:hypothetical protein
MNLTPLGPTKTSKVIRKTVRTSRRYNSDDSRLRINRIQTLKEQINTNL